MNRLSIEISGLFTDRFASDLFSPTAKALELFLASLVEASVKDAQSRGSQKLTAYGL
jgi:hypothetical protein